MDFTHIQYARERLRRQAHVTPVMTSRTLDARAGARVFLKCENLQRIGAFKFRGAFNAISQLSDEERKCGVVTHSSGNHAQAVALVAKLLDVKAIVVMPRDASEAKRRAAEALGATVVGCEASEREAVALRVQEAHGCVLVPPFDHFAVIAGQGTATVEFMEQVNALDALLVPVGGGGLISGSAIAAKHICPNCRVIGVEPALGDDATRSFQSKTLQTVENCLSIADGTRTRSLGKLTFPIILKNVDEFVTVSEEAIMDAVRFLFFRMKIVVEPSGALGVAALLSGAWKGRGRIGVILSGGNMDAATMTRILAAG